MATNKKPRHVADLKKLYDQIEGELPITYSLASQAQSSLIKIKPKLQDITAPTVDTASVVKDLHQIASLAKALTEQRLKSSGDGHLADALDQQVWLHPDPVEVRLAGFRLMEAGLEAKPSIEG
ncbi:hypothetical protein ID866_4763 [Astraeus odoratus]|nr:hypothetical protein ID866_4763 [Astraeus odoratus]